MTASKPDSTRDFSVHSRYRRIDCPDFKASLFSPDLGFTQIPKGVRTSKSRSGCIAAEPDPAAVVLKRRFESGSRHRVA